MKPVLISNNGGHHCETEPEFHSLTELHLSHIWLSIEGLLVKCSLSIRGVTVYSIGLGDKALWFDLGEGSETTCHTSLLRINSSLNQKWLHSNLSIELLTMALLCTLIHHIQSFNAVALMYPTGSCFVSTCSLSEAFYLLPLKTVFTVSCLPLNSAETVK